MSNIPCPECGGAVPVPDELAHASNDLALLRGQYTSLLRKVAKLQSDLEKQKASEPETDDAKAVGVHWKERLGHQKAKLPASGARLVAVRARLNDGFTVEQLKRAVDGCARVPFVGPHGRQPDDSKGAKRHDDLTLICRNEETVERFIRYADEADQPQPVRPSRKLSPQDSAKRAEWHRENRYGGAIDGRDPLTRVLEWLHDKRCTVKGSGSRFMAQCPAHADSDPSLSIRERADKAVLLHCFAGCHTLDVLEAMGMRYADIGPEGGVFADSDMQARERENRQRGLWEAA